MAWPPNLQGQNPFLYTVRNMNYPLMMAGLGLLSGGSPQEQFKQGLMGLSAGFDVQGQRDERKRRAAQQQALDDALAAKEGMTPELARAASAFPELGISLLTPPKQDQTAEYRNFLQSGFPGSFYEYQTSLRGAAAPRTMGTPPPGYRVVYDKAQNPISMEPIPGGPAAQEAEAAAQQAEIGRRQRETSANVVVDDIDRAIKLIQSSPRTTTGPGGQLLQNVPGTTARDVKALVDTIRANTGFDRLQAMRDASPTGGALGQVSEQENKLLQAALGNLEQSQSTEQLVQNLERVRTIYLEIIHGPGIDATVPLSPADPRWSGDYWNNGDGAGWWTDPGSGARVRPLP